MDVDQDLRFQSFGRRVLPFFANVAEELDLDVRWGLAVERIKEKRFNGEGIAGEGGADAGVRDGVPRTAGVQIPGTGDVDAMGRNKFGWVSRFKVGTVCLEPMPWPVTTAPESA